MRPYLVAAAALAFVSGVGNFGIPALLGLPVNYLTLTTLIYQRIASFGPGVLPQVAALSVLIAFWRCLAWRCRRWRATGDATRYSGGIACALCPRALALAAGRACAGGHRRSC